jgi:hypothetical protein
MSLRHSRDDDEKLFGDNWRDAICLVDGIIPEDPAAQISMT